MGYYVLFLALTLVGPLVKLLVLLLAFGLLGRLRLGNVAFPILVDTVLRTAISYEQVEISVDPRKRRWIERVERTHQISPVLNVPYGQPINPSERQDRSSVSRAHQSLVER